MSTCKRSLHLSYRQFLNPTLMFGQKMAVSNILAAASGMHGVPFSVISFELACVRRDIAIINQTDFVMANKILDGILKQKKWSGGKAAVFHKQPISDND